MKTKFVSIVILTLLLTPTVRAREYHVATNGDDAAAGTQAAPLRTIQHAADLAQPGDVITVHEGIYRERVNPPRGGTSDQQRITYQAAPGEKVVITGSEIIKGWEKVGNDTWKVTIPNKFFGEFNPYIEIIHGDWFNPKGRTNHRGCVYLNGVWLDEARDKNEVMKPAGTVPVWFAEVDGASPAGSLVNLRWFKPGKGNEISAVQASAKRGTQPAGCSEGGQCVGFIEQQNWLRYDDVDFGSRTDEVEFRVASPKDSIIEIRQGQFNGELLGRANVSASGDWQKWTSVTAKINPLSGKNTICLVFKPAHSDTGNTVIYAQFHGVDPNREQTEINVRPTVFTPARPFVDYITVRGFTLKNAATNWASPSEGQVGLITAYWCKGWIIENNEVCYSKCAGITLGKISDEGDGRNNGTGGYYNTIKDAQTKSRWDKGDVGSHIVRNNHIHDCEQAGIDGSLGAVYSQVSGNLIHDIYVRRTYDGAEQAGIKFHGAVDTVITGNHIYRSYRGMWLDWMTQGTQVRGNFLHDNDLVDVTVELSHGPALFANNIFGSVASKWSFLFNAQNSVVAHNLVANRAEECNGDGRQSPYFKPHTTETLGMAGAGPANSFYYNNLFFWGKGNGLPVFLDGNVFWNDAPVAAKDKIAINLPPEADPGFRVIEKPDGWYIEFTADADWRHQQRKLAATDLVGTATLSGQRFENPDGSPYQIDADYFGKKRDINNPFPGPFEITSSGKQMIKVWPKN